MKKTIKMVNSKLIQKVNLDNLEDKQREEQRQKLKDRRNECWRFRRTDKEVKIKKAAMQIKKERMRRRMPLINSKTKKVPRKIQVSLTKS